MCIATIWSDLWVLPAIILPLLTVGALLAIKFDPTCARAFRGWRQRYVIRHLTKQLPKQIANERQQLLRAWDGNPAARCAALFDRFINPREKKSRTEVADDVDMAVASGCQLFQSDFVDRYGDFYASLLVVQTAEIAKSLAAQQPANAAFVYHKLAQNDEELFRGFDASVRKALAEGRAAFAIIRAHLEQLRENSERFRRIIDPGFFANIGNIIVGALTGAALGAVGIDSDSVIRHSARFTAGIWADWTGKADEEFADKFCEAMTEVAVVSENMDAGIRRSLTAALDMYLQHKLQHQKTTLDALSELTRAGWDVNSSITYCQQVHTRNRTVTG